MSIAQRGVSHSMPALQEFHDSTLYLIRAETAVIAYFWKKKIPVPSPKCTIYFARLLIYAYVVVSAVSGSEAGHSREIRLYKPDMPT